MMNKLIHLCKLIRGKPTFFYLVGFYLSNNCHVFCSSYIVLTFAIFLLFRMLSKYTHSANSRYIVRARVRRRREKTLDWQERKKRRKKNVKQIKSFFCHAFIRHCIHWQLASHSQRDWATVFFCRNIAPSEETAVNRILKITFSFVTYSHE